MRTYQRQLVSDVVDTRASNGGRIINSKNYTGRGARSKPPEHRKTGPPVR